MIKEKIFSSLREKLVESLYVGSEILPGEEVLTDIDLNNVTDIDANNVETL